MIGVLVMAYGTPASLDDVEAYYTHIRRGRPPSLEQLADLRQRYDAIGGVSPLAERTRDQAKALAAALERDDPGVWRVALGNKHAPPFVEDGVTALASETDGGPPVSQIVGLVLAPHWSRASVGEYHERATAEATTHGLTYEGIEAWHDEPAWRDAQAERVRQARAALPEACKVLFTAHSLPERLLADDPYDDQLWTSAAAIAGLAGLNPWYGWSLAWQSAGRTPEPWRGPDVADVIRQLGESRRTDGVLVCPQGFVSDHLEVLYDLDVDAAQVAAEAGLAFGRTASINDDPAVMAALAARARRTATR
jgi:protoporphyrin/coproporphyrin ferrochelatase